MSKPRQATGEPTSISAPDPSTFRWRPLDEGRVRSLARAGLEAELADADEPARKLPRAPFDQVLWTRIGVAVCALVACVSCVVALLSSPRIVRLRSADAPDHARQEIEAAALGFTRAWHPADRARVAAQLQNSGRPDDLRRALRDALARNDRRLTPGLLAAASALDAREARREITSVAGAGGGGSAAAVTIAHRMQRFTASELEDLLRRGDPAARVKVFEAVAREGGELPEAALLAWLLSEDARERALALAAFPARPADSLVAELTGLVRHGDVELAARALRALARCGDATPFVALAVARLTGQPDTVRRAALEFLVQTGDPAHSDELWRVVIDGTAGSDVRLFALHALEQLGGGDPEKLSGQVPLFSTSERLLAARCLIRAGDQRGFGLLLGILDCGEEAVSTSSRRLLAWLTGAPVNASPAQFEAAFAQAGRRVRTRYLPEHSLMVH